jgi:antitoxin component HigA of HigAB toxin-antitoxin module
MKPRYKQEIHVSEPLFNQRAVRETLDAILDALDDERGRHGWSLSDLSRAIGRAANTSTTVLYHRRATTVDTLLRMIDALGLRVALIDGEGRDIMQDDGTAF